MLSIVSPATGRALTTLAAVKADLEITGTGDDTFLASLIAQASAAIETWCGRVFVMETVRETIDIKACTDSVMLSRFPVTEIVSATLAGEALDTDTLEVEDGGLLYRTKDGSRICWSLGRAVIEYEAGFILPDEDEPTLPDDINRAAILLVRHGYYARGRDPSIRVEESEGVGSTTYGLAGIGNGNTLPPEVQGLLCRHQIVAGF